MTRIYSKRTPCNKFGLFKDYFCKVYLNWSVWWQQILLYTYFSVAYLQWTFHFNFSWLFRFNRWLQRCATNCNKISIILWEIKTQNKCVSYHQDFNFSCLLIIKHFGYRTKGVLGSKIDKLWSWWLSNNTLW